MFAVDPHPQSEARQQSGSPTQEPQPGPSGMSTSQEKDEGPPPPPKDVLDALQQRLHKYQQASDKAKEEGNSSKARRMGRIVKVQKSCGQFTAAHVQGQNDPLFFH